jgi:DNA modification methylase
VLGAGRELRSRRRLQSVAMAVCPLGRRQIDPYPRKQATGVVSESSRCAIALTRAGGNLLHRRLRTAYTGTIFQARQLFFAPVPTSCDACHMASRKAAKRSESFGFTTTQKQASNVLCYGDNLPILREFIKDESVDLIYLDPPFNSQRAYNVIFKEEDAAEPEAQVKAFDDYWRWDASAEATYQDLVNPRPHTRGAPERLIVLIESLRKSLGDGNMLAYLVMMSVRLLELHRVLKPTGSLYLHCDPTASHYLKLLLDAVFGPDKFRSEIVWKRSGAHSDAKQGRRLHGHIHDVLLFYTKGREWTWNDVYTPYGEAYVGRDYKLIDEEGRRFRRGDLTAAKPGGNTEYEWRVKRHKGVKERWIADLDDEFRSPDPEWDYKGIRPYKGRYWAYSIENMHEYARTGRLRHTFDGMPEYKRFLDEMPGIPLQDLWTDILPLIAGSPERLGYPTQKPVALLERIIRSSSNPGDVVLDPFCGCGTAIEAAEKLMRAWIGIDITYLAIPIIRRRLAPIIPPAQFRIIGAPEDLKSARTLAESDPYQFQWWSLDKIGAFPVNSLIPMGREGKKGGDKGIDGIIRFRERPEDQGSQRIIVSVKAGESLSPGMVRDLRGTIEREKAPIGVMLLMHEPTAQMRTEAANAGKYRMEGTNREYDRIQILTTKDIFDKKRVEFPGYDVTEEEIAASGQLPLFDPAGVRKAAKPAKNMKPPVAVTLDGATATKAKRGHG